MAGAKIARKIFKYGKKWSDTAWKNVKDEFAKELRKRKEASKKGIAQYSTPKLKPKIKDPQYKPHPKGGY